VLKEQFVDARPLTKSLPVFLNGVELMQPTVTYIYCVYSSVYLRDMDLQLNLPNASYPETISYHVK